MKFVALVAAFALPLLSYSGLAQAQTAEDAFGLWLDPGNGGHIDVVKCDDKLCAKVAFVPNNDGPDGPKVDKNNPDENKKSQPVLGLTLIENAYKASEKSWQGSIYNPVDGKTYSATLTVKDTDTLDLKGCIMSVLCRTQSWTRVKK
jgi:uncharacterized protein (DUF2147 family)